MSFTFTAHERAHWSFEHRDVFGPSGVVALAKTSLTPANWWAVTEDADAMLRALQKSNADPRAVGRAIAEARTADRARTAWDHLTDAELAQCEAHESEWDAWLAGSDAPADAKWAFSGFDVLAGRRAGSWQAARRGARTSGVTDAVVLRRHFPTFPL